ncbi:MAG: exodeoxyribonuclease VII large subunit [Gammaproteobacteria bacterium]
MRDIYTVSRLNGEARALLERQFGSIWIEGELSNLARPRSGHWYFSLKDSSAQARCAMFRSRNALVGFEPGEGMHVLARTRVGMYEPRGEFQLVVEHLELAGEGMLRLKFEQLKRQLAAEGLFDAAHKIDLPVWPARIGVVTSPSGAAIRDILTVLKRRNPAIDVVIYPVSVQGATAAPEIAAAIATANARAECDVLIIGRGGGSLEDLWAFNEEIVARALFASDLPTVSAVGHEIDFTIADLVADVRAPTPSASAELCSTDATEILRLVKNLGQRLAISFGTTLNDYHRELRHLRARLQHPGRRLEQFHQRIDELMQRLPAAAGTGIALRRSRVTTLDARIRACNPRHRVASLDNRVASAQQRLHAAMGKNLQAHRATFDETTRALAAVSPKATLARGYAIVTDGAGRIARDAGNYAPGERVTASLAHGRLTLDVAAVEPDGDPLPPGGDGS